MTRPPHPDYQFEPTSRVPQGFEWVAEPEEGWTMERPTTKAGKPAADRCRYFVGGRAHGAPAVAWLFRSVWSRPGGVPWAYCGEHLFGRWIEDGRVMNWRLRPKAAPA